MLVAKDAVFLSPFDDNCVRMHPTLPPSFIHRWCPLARAPTSYSTHSLEGGGGVTDSAKYQKSIVNFCSGDAMKTVGPAYDPCCVWAMSARAVGVPEGCWGSWGLHTAGTQRAGGRSGAAAARGNSERRGREWACGVNRQLPYGAREPWWREWALLQDGGAGTAEGHKLGVPYSSFIPTLWFFVKEMKRLKVLCKPT